MPLTLEDVRPGVWIVSNKDDEVMRRRRLFASKNNGITISVVTDTGHIMIEDQSPFQVLQHYEKDWRVEK